MEKYLNILNVLLSKLPINLYWMDIEGKVILCNDNQAKAFGLKVAKDIIGKDIFTIGEMLDWEKKVAETVFKHNTEIIETLIPYEVEESFISKGKKKTFLAHKLPWQDENGKVIGIFGFTLDITERKKLENSLQQAKEQAERANKVKSEFIKNMAHDFRTPFSGIYGLAEYMYSREIEAEKKENLGLVTESAKILLDYANEIINFAEAESQSIPIKDDTINIRQLVEQLITVEKPAAKIKQLQLKSAIKPGVPEELVGDEYRLRTILLNLLGNAIKFTNTGSVELTVSLIGYTDNENISLQIAIKDTGIGLPPDKIAFIKDKFNRLTSSYQGRHKGTGLGLPTIKQFLKDINGEIYIDSKLGEGSTFNCIIPFKIVE